MPMVLWLGAKPVGISIKADKLKTKSPPEWALAIRARINGHHPK